MEWIFKVTRATLEIEYIIFQFQGVHIMNNDPAAIKANLDRIIEDFAANPKIFSKNPESDFTRNRKLPVSDVLRFSILMERDSVDMELLKYLDFDPGSTPTQSAYIQQRSKLVPGTFKMLLDRFNDTIPAASYQGNIYCMAWTAPGLILPITRMTPILSIPRVVNQNPEITRYMLLHPAALQTISSQTPSSSHAERKMSIRQSVIWPTTVRRKMESPFSLPTGGFLPLTCSHMQKKRG